MNRYRWEEMGVMFDKLKRIRMKRRKRIVNIKPEEQDRKRKGGFKIFFFSFIMTIILFFLLVGLQAGILENYEKVNVVIAKSNIEDGMEITADNLSSYFVLKEVDASLKTNSVFENIFDLEGYVVRKKIDKNEIISKNGLEKKNTILSSLKEPVEAGLKVSDISQVVGGILRSGDLIDILAINNDTKKAEKVFSNVYVSRVFNSGGKEIMRTDTDAPAVAVNVIIDKEYEALFHEKITSEVIRISKINGLK